MFASARRARRSGALPSSVWRKVAMSRLKKRAVASQGGGPYRITRRGLELVRAEFDNR